MANMLLSIDYYWRDYYGFIPPDAVPAGKDLHNNTTFIGQGLVIGRGIIPGVIYPGQQDIVVPVSGTQKISYGVKILCSRHPAAFKWLPSSASTFYRDMINVHAVRVGYEDNCLLNIGRVSSQGEVITGKIKNNSPSFPGIAPMFFAYRNQEKRVDSYEVLHYKQN